MYIVFHASAYTGQGINIKMQFNSDLSKWDTAAVKDTSKSTFNDSHIDL